MDRDLRERLIASKTVFEGRLISVSVDEVELADGRRTRREVVHHPGAAAVVPVLPDGRVVMIRQYRHATGSVLYELPAGLCEPGEAPVECARRELGEEVGYQAEEMELLFSVYLSPGYSSELIHVFLAGGLRPVEAKPDPDEQVVPVALPLDAVVAMIARGEVQNAAAVCGVLAAAQRASVRRKGSRPRH